MQIAVRMEFMWGVPKVKGTAVVCEAGGIKKTYTYKLVWVHDPQNFSITLRPPDEPFLAIDLTGHFKPGSLKVEWLGTRAKTGILHKGSAEQFDTLCKKLR